MLLPLVAQRIQSGFGDQRVIFRKVVDQFDVLIHRARIVVHARERGDQAAAQGSNLRFARIGRKRRIAESGDLVEIELLQPLVVARLRVRVGHSGEIFAVVGSVFQQSGKQVARLLKLFCVGRFARGFIGELRAQRGIGIFRGLQQHGNRLRLHLHAPVEIDGGAHHAENLRILAVERFDILLGSGEILAALVELDQADSAVAGE